MSIFGPHLINRRGADSDSKTADEWTAVTRFALQKAPKAASRTPPPTASDRSERTRTRTISGAPVSSAGCEANAIVSRGVSGRCPEQGVVPGREHSEVLWNLGETKNPRAPCSERRRSTTWLGTCGDWGGLRAKRSSSSSSATSLKSGASRTSRWRGRRGERLRTGFRGSRASAGASARPFSAPGPSSPSPSPSPLLSCPPLLPPPYRIPSIPLLPSLPSLPPSIHLPDVSRRWCSRQVSPTYRMALATDMLRKMIMNQQQGMMGGGGGGGGGQGQPVMPPGMGQMGALGGLPAGVNPMNGACHGHLTPALLRENRGIDSFAYFSLRVHAPGAASSGRRRVWIRVSATSIGVTGCMCGACRTTQTRSASSTTRRGSFPGTRSPMNITRIPNHDSFLSTRWGGERS